MSQKESPDIIATIRFRTTAEGGRNGPILTDTLRCMMVFGPEVFDCLLMLQQVGNVQLGEIVTVPMRFLVADLLRGKLKPGDKFYLRDYRVIADGEVKSVLLEGKPREPNSLDETQSL